MFNKKTVLSIIALAITGLFAGCADSGSDTTDQGVGNAIFDLTAVTAGGYSVCLSGQFNLNKTDAPTATYPINSAPTCGVAGDDALTQVGLLAGMYEVPDQDGIPCQYDDDGNPLTAALDTTCTVSSDPVPVATGGLVTISVSVTVHTVDGDIPTVSGAGIGNISMATPTVSADLCVATDTTPDCGAGSTCWEIGTAAQACYPDCTFSLVDPTGGTCTGNLTCVPLFDDGDPDVTEVPAIGVEIPVTTTTLVGACMNLGT